MYGFRWSEIRLLYFTYFSKEHKKQVHKVSEVDKKMGFQNWIENEGTKSCYY